MTEILEGATQGVVSALVKIPDNNYDDLNDFYGNHGENLGYLYLTGDKCSLTSEYPMYMGDVKITRICMNKKIISAMIRIFNKTLEHYGLEKIVKLGLDQYGGCLNVRLKKGSKTEWSTHSWGIAVDMDPLNNTIHMSWEESRFSAPIYAPFIQFWYDEGFENLGKSHNFDSMHFQACKGR